MTGADERLTHADELVATADAAGLREPAVLGRQLRVILLLQRGDVLEAEAELARFEYAARELRQPILLVHLQWLHSMWAMLGGRLEDAERLAAEAVASHSRANPLGARAAYTGQLAFLRREQGRFAEMEPVLRERLDEQPRAYIWRAALLLLLTEEGRHDEARALLDTLVADGVLDLGDNDPHTVTPDQATPPTLSEAVALLGDEHAARVLYRHLRPFAGRVVVTAAWACTSSVPSTTTWAAWRPRCGDGRMPSGTSGTPSPGTGRCARGRSSPALGMAWLASRARGRPV